MEIFFNVHNPLLFILLTVSSFVLVAHFSAIKIFRPMKKLHQKEKLILELEKENLHVLFAKLNPSPLFRFDESGNIILSNAAGESILRGCITGVINIKSLIKELGELNLSEIISSSQEHSLISKINDRDYNIVVIGVPGYQFGHAYFFDITE